MRIVGGQFVRQTIAVPQLAGVRPTSERVRESLFTRLGTFEGLDVLDLFAGSGVLGLEALSRGASHATFVERSVAAVKIIEKNVASCGGLDSANVVCRDVFPWLKQNEKLFDILFIDPPYERMVAYCKKLDSLLVNAMKASSLVVIESSYRQPAQLSLLLEDERRYGETLIRCYRL